MARRPAIRSIPHAILLSAGIFGLTAGVAPRSAAAQPTTVAEVAAEAPDPSQALPATPSVALDQYPPPSARRNLLIFGVASTAVWYGGALATSYAVDDPAMAKDLRIPFAGPWMALTHTGCGGGPQCNTLLVVLGAIATTLDGIGQAAGLALAAEGLFMPTQEPRAKRAAARRKDFDWRPTFDAGKNTVGFGVLGVF
ncbi:MAG TPA: hypothetical protein VJV79_20125 [Polyangiaceae bacterium]|nr:hypothetical protein [Polyangiaceae bacterium]